MVEMKALKHVVTPAPQGPGKTAHRKPGDVFAVDEKDAAILERDGLAVRVAPAVVEDDEAPRPKKRSKS